MSEFLSLPESYSPELREFDRKVVRVVNGAMNGKTNNTGEVTLTTSTVTSTVTLAAGRIGQDSLVMFMPTTANAATELAAGGMFVSSRSVADNLFRITHANNTQNDRIFKFMLIG